MHPYATDSSERVTIPVLLAGAAVWASFELAKVISHWGLQDKLWWVDLPAVWGFYVLLWNVFDRALWNLRVLRAVRLVKVPDFSGTWRGHGLSSYKDEDGKPKRFEVKVVIRQQWTKCAVHLETSTSQSDSIIGAVLVGDGGHASLSYEYRNQPRAHAEESMHAHPGMTRLERIDATHLEGEYYTGRDRQNYGTLHLTKEGSAARAASQE